MASAKVGLGWVGARGGSLDTFCSVAAAQSPLTGIPQKETKWCGRGVVWTMWTTEEVFSSKTKEIWNTRCPESFLALLEGSSWNQ